MIFLFCPHNRYLPLLCATFKFPQSLGILGGRPGASTYIVGVQDEKAFYLDPHEVQQVSATFLVQLSQCFLIWNCWSIFHDKKSNFLYLLNNASRPRFNYNTNLLRRIIQPMSKLTLC